MPTRMNAANRKRMIRVNAAVLAGEIGLANITFENVADRCPVETSASTVRHYFRYLHDLQTECVDFNPDLREQAVQLGIVEK